MKRLHRSLFRAVVVIDILVVVLAALAFTWGVPFARHLADVQASPALLSLFSHDGSVGGVSSVILSLVIFHVVFTVLFGRLFCAILCPLGAMQELIYFLWRKVYRKARKTMPRVPNLKILRYGLLALSIALLALGFAAGFLYLDPYSTTGKLLLFRKETLLCTLIGFSILIVIVGLQRRAFCANVCPVGALLGLLSKRTATFLAVEDSCVHCGKCVSICPTDCIDVKAGTVDNERCVRCMECLATCPKDAIGWKTLPRNAQENPEKTEDAPASPSRRNFLKCTAAIAVGTGLGVVLGKTGLAAKAPKKPKNPDESMLPPGAGGLDLFSTKCTGCGLCVAQCPSQILVPAKGGYGPVALDLARGEGVCGYECHRCSEVCPTGAIPKMPLAEKRKTPIGLATIDFTKCRVFQEDDVVCGKCAETCPAKAIELRKTGAPKPPKPSLCIGCGACAKTCPGSAIQVGPVVPAIQI